MNLPPKDQDIISLYQSLEADMPPVELDEKILNYASEQKSLVSRRRLWPYVGLAASLVFVTLLAPWQWMEQPVMQQMDSEPRIESFMVAPEPSAVRDRVKVEREIRAKQMERRKAAESERDAELELSFNVFWKVETLLREGKEEEARALLAEMLKDEPKLEAQLPQHLKQLLTIKTEAEGTSN